jgi:hypothetical protein
METKELSTKERGITAQPVPASCALPSGSSYSIPPKIAKGQENFGVRLLGEVARPLR